MNNGNIHDILRKIDSNYNYSKIKIWDNGNRAIPFNIWDNVPIAGVGGVIHIHIIWI